MWCCVSHGTLSVQGSCLSLSPSLLLGVSFVLSVCNRLVIVSTAARAAGKRRIRRSSALFSALFQYCRNKLAEVTQQKASNFSSSWQMEMILCNYRKSKQKKPLNLDSSGFRLQQQLVLPARGCFGEEVGGRERRGGPVSLSERKPRGRFDAIHTELMTSKNRFQLLNIKLKGEKKTLQCFTGEC